MREIIDKRVYGFQVSRKVRKEKKRKARKAYFLRSLRISWRSA